MFFLVYLLSVVIFSVKTDEQILLKNGVLSGPYDLKHGEDKFFKYDIPEKGTSEVVIISVPEEGDGDLLASCKIVDPTFSKCTFKSCWKSFNPGEDTLDITPKQLGDCETVYVGVHEYGKKDGKFSMFAYSRTQNGTIPIKLALGKPLPGLVKQGEYDFFEFINNELYVLNVTVSVHVRSHHILEPDSDLYVGRGYLPTREHNDYHSESVRGEEQINLKLNAAEKIGISIYAYLGTTEYNMQIIRNN